MKNHSTRRLAAILALTALIFIPLRSAAQTEAAAWTTDQGTTFWARLIGWNGTELILMTGDKDFRVPVSRLSAQSVSKAAQTLGLPESRLTKASAPSCAARKPETKKVLTYGELYGSGQPQCQAAVPVVVKRNSCARPAAEVTRPQEDEESVVVESQEESTPESNSPDLGNKIIAFCNAHMGMKVGNGQCTSLAAEALEAAGAARMGKDFPKRGDYVWGEQVALLEYDRREIAGLESLAKVRPGDIVQFRNARLAGRGPGGGTYGMTADHHTAVVASVDPATAILTIYHQNWGKMIVKQDRMQLTDLKSGWLRIYRPIAAE